MRFFSTFPPPVCRKRAARREWEMERKLEQSVRHGGESGLPLISEGEGATAVQLLHSPDIHKHPAAVSRTILQFLALL
jgi:hypothetical protein